MTESSMPLCGICLESGMPEWGAFGRCSHRFCWGCTMQWVAVDSRCPNCKEEVGRVTKTLLSAQGTFSPATPLEVVEVPSRRQEVEDEGENPFDVDADNIVCDVCGDGGDEHILLLCDGCQRGFHTRCVGLSSVPEGDYYCRDCVPSLDPAEAPAAVPAEAAPSQPPQVDLEDDTAGSTDDKSESGAEEEPPPAPRRHTPRRSARAAVPSPAGDSIAHRTRSAARSGGVASRTRQATRVAEEATRVRRTLEARRNRAGRLHRPGSPRGVSRHPRQPSSTEPSSASPSPQQSPRAQGASEQPAPRPASNSGSASGTSSQRAQVTDGAQPIKISDLRRQLLQRQQEDQSEGSTVRTGPSGSRRRNPPPGPNFSPRGGSCQPRPAQDEGLFGGDDGEEDNDDVEPRLHSPGTTSWRERTNSPGVRGMAADRERPKILSRREEELLARMAARRSELVEEEAPQPARNPRPKRSRDEDEPEGEGNPAKQPRHELPSFVREIRRQAAQMPGPVHSMDNSLTGMKLWEDLKVLRMRVHTKTKEFLRGAENLETVFTLTRELAKAAYDQLEKDLRDGAALESVASSPRITAALIEHYADVLDRVTPGGS